MNDHNLFSSCTLVNIIAEYIYKFIYTWNTNRNIVEYIWPIIKETAKNCVLIQILAFCWTITSCKCVYYGTN